MAQDTNRSCMIATSSTPQRLCPQCGATTPILTGEALWPSNWICSSCSHPTDNREGVVLTAPDLADTISGFDPRDFDYLAKAELDHFWFSVRRNLIIDLVAKYAGNAGSFLEIGCGSGNVINAMARSREWDRIVGTEIHPSGLAHAALRLPPNVELLQADARHLPFSQAFDLIGAFDVLEHIAEDEAVLSEIRRALVPKGIFIATVPQHPWLWSLADEVAYHERRYRRGELESRLAAAGFEILFTTSYTTILLPLMALSRVLNRKRSDPADARQIVRKEFEISPLMNSVLRAALRLETALTIQGVAWPFGGSRVVIARKL